LILLVLRQYIGAANQLAPIYLRCKHLKIRDLAPVETAEGAASGLCCFLSNVSCSVADADPLGYASFYRIRSDRHHFTGSDFFCDKKSE
jgi:hypothetical protein